MTFPVEIRLNAIVGAEHGGYISLNAILSVDFHQIGPLNLI